MTRMEWMRIHYPKAVDKDFVANILGCPNDYDKLCKADISANECKLGKYECVAPSCSECWNMTIISPNIKSEEVTK